MVHPETLYLLAKSRQKESKTRPSATAWSGIAARWCTKSHETGSASGNLRWLLIRPSGA